MTTPKTVLALGEVLWDLFPDGPRFGGAPANFACACASLGGARVKAALASAVGRDKLGDEALARLRGHGVDTARVTACDQLTGRVHVTLDEAGRASYGFADDPAWDHLAATPELLDLARAADVVYFGTLAQRAAPARDAILAAVRSTSPGCIRVLDVNLRPPHWSAGVLAESLQLATVLKLSDEELPVLGEALGIGGTEGERLRAILAKFPLRLIALTRGQHGSVLLAADGTRSESAGMAVEVVNTVGAGDAFTAAVALGLAHDLDLDRINRWAGEVAGYVCTQPGATPTFPARFRLPA